MATTTHSGGNKDGDAAFLRLLQDFLHFWSTTTKTVDSRGETESLWRDYLARLTPPLTAPLPRSFRPSEVVPGLYLGAFRDIQDIGELSHRLRTATQVCATGSGGGPSVPHSLFLVIRACPLLGVESARLERRGIRRPRKAAVVSSKDICLETYSLQDVWDIIDCGPSIETTVPTAAAVEKSGSDFQRRVNSLQQFLSTPYTPDAATLASALSLSESNDLAPYPPPPRGDVDLIYWRLMLPIEDEPEYNIAQHIPLTNLFLHAVLTMSATSRSGLPPLQQSPEGSIRDNTVPTVSGDTQMRPSTGVSQPCAVVHCIAGKSRSTTIVAHYLLRVWVSWATAAVASSSSPLSGNPASIKALTLAATSKKDKVALAKRLADALLSFIRTRRMCIDVNPGFQEQLVQYSYQQLLAISGEMP